LRAVRLLNNYRPEYFTVAPSITQGPSSYNAIGDVSPYVDRGNLHLYTGGRHPETGLWGANGYATTQFNMSNAAISFGSKKAYITETGFDSNVLPEGIILRYMIRSIVYYYSLGIERTYWYQFVAGGGDAFSNFGLVGWNGTTLPPRPSYRALQAFMKIAAGAVGAPLPAGITIPNGVLSVPQTGWIESADAVATALGVGRGCEAGDRKQQQAAGRDPGRLQGAVVQRRRIPGGVG
jgi:hypothetical protein